MTTRRFLVALCFALLGSLSVARADGPADAAEQQVADSIASLRAAEHVAPLRRDADLDEAALLHAEDMATNQFVGHESPTSGDPAARVRSVGARVSRVGENVARAASTSEAVAGLVASASHRAQILSSDYTNFGVAVVEGEDGFYVVEVFAARPAGDALPPPSAVDVPDAPYATVDGGFAPDAAAIAPDMGRSQQFQPSVDPRFTQSPQYATPSVPMATTPVVGPSGAPTYAAYGPQYGGTATTQGSPDGAPYVTLQAIPASNVQGYWVNYNARWWYFPIPAGARPGQVLTVSSTVTGNPPGVTGAPSGYRAPGTVAAAPYALMPVAQVQSRGRFGFMRSPRRW